MNGLGERFARLLISFAPDSKMAPSGVARQRHLSVGSYRRPGNVADAEPDLAVLGRVPRSVRARRGRTLRLCSGQ